MRHHFVSALAAMTPVVAAAVPFQVHHQGRLLDTTGQPVVGSHAVVFKLHVDGTTTAHVWTESMSPVPFEDGYYSVTLGNVAPLDATVFSGSTRWLSLALDGGAELGPRTAIVSVPYAVRATTADSATTATTAATATALADPATFSSRVRCETFRGVWNSTTNTCSPGAFLPAGTTTYGGGMAHCQAQGAFHMCGFPEVTAYLPDLLARGTTPVGWVACGRPDQATSGGVKKIGISQDASDSGTGTCPATHGCNWESYFVHCHRTESTQLPVYCCRN
jgi:hypothetical protein